MRLYAAVPKQSNRGSDGRLCPQPIAGARVRYYELFDDMTIPKRWHLGEVTLADGREPPLWDGLRFADEGELTASVTHPGRVLEFSLTTYAVPVATTQLAKAVSSIADADVQCLPVMIAGQAGMMVLNALRVIRCLDETRSEFIKWTKDDHRADLAGQYRQVSKLVLDPETISADNHFFRIEGWDIARIVSETVKNAMDRVGCLGAKFIELQT